jgi:hypothetical protein
VGAVSQLDGPTKANYLRRESSARWLKWAGRGMATEVQGWNVIGQNWDTVCYGQAVQGREQLTSVSIKGTSMLAYGCTGLTKTRAGQERAKTDWSACLTYCSSAMAPG